MESHGIVIELFWIPGDAGIRGNDVDDKAAKSAAIWPIVDIHFIFLDDMQVYLKQFVFQNRQVQWMSIKSNKLRTIEDAVRHGDLSGGIIGMKTLSHAYV